MDHLEYYTTIYNGNLSRKMATKEPYYTHLLKSTSFLPFECDYKERIYCLLNNITIRPKCKCGEFVKFPAHLAKTDRCYREFCSTKCSNNDKNVKIKKENTCKTNYGVINPSQSKEIHQLKINTITKNHGGFGMQSPTISKIIKETNILKYGTPFSSKNNIIKNKIKNSHLKRSKHQNKISNDKRKTTMIIKYGIDHNPINHFSKIATKYIENFIKNNNLDPKLCMYGEKEYFVKVSNKIFFFDLVVFKTHSGRKNKDINDIYIILEYDGKFWHPTIDQSITYRNTPMVLQGMTYREKFLHDMKKQLIATQIIKKNNGKYERIKKSKQ